MREYIINRFAKYDDCDWNSVPKANIDIYKWGGEDHYEPESYAQVALIENFGLVAHLVTKETNPMAKAKAFYDDVWCDSCLEFFAAIDNKTDYYFNCEMNSRGICLIGYGKDRYDRVKITDFIEKPFDIRSVVRDDKWSVTASISFEDIEKIFGVKKEQLKPGYSFKGNFYKCGDETEYPHFGMWSEILVDDDFHQPKFFSTLTIGE